MARDADAATDRPSADGSKDVAASADAPLPDPRRRAALAKLGRTAAYGVPATVGLMMMPRAARAC